MIGFLRRWLPLLGIAAVAALALYWLGPPRPLPAEAPATEFAAGRTGPDLDSLARQPHPLGSADHQRVRRYLLRRLRQLGLRPRVQDTTVLLAVNGQPTLAHVQNIEARQPGTQPGNRAVLVLAHYDSQPHTPGAGDDAAGVAAMLEAIRALRTGPPLAREVIWLFTDGEEAGLLGARAYAADTARLRRQVGVALNFEGRGNRGPSLTFEVSPHNGWLLGQYAQAVSQPVASSLFYEAYRRLPNNTDFTPLREAGVAGLNFAFVGGFPYYHSPTDTPAHLSLGSVQHHGSYLLHLVRQFGSQSLTATQAPDVTFFSVGPGWLVRYPAAWSLPLVGAGLLLLLLVAALAQQYRRLSWGGLLGGALSWLLGVGLLLLAGWGLLALLHQLYPQYAAFYAGTFYNSLACQLALLALGLSIWSFYYSLLSRWLTLDALVGGCLLAVLGLAEAAAWAAPTSAYVLTWPALAATLGWGLGQLLRPVRPSGQLASLPDWLLALPTVLLLAPVGYLLLEVFGLGSLVLLVLLVLAVALGLLLPLLLPVLRQPAPARPAATGRPRFQPCFSVPLLGLVGAALALGWAQLTSQPTADKPQQTHLAYYLDAPAHRAYWLSDVAHPDAWAQQVLGAGQPAGPAPAGLPVPPARWAPAPVRPLPVPQLQVMADTVLGGQRRLSLRLQPGRASLVQLRLADTTAQNRPLGVRVAGVAVPPRALQQGLLLLPPAAGAPLVLALPPRTRLRLELRSSTLGLPGGAGLPPLPAQVVPAPGFLNFTTQTRQQLQL